MASKANAGTGADAGAGEGGFNLRFWGVRGGIPTTNADTLRFGGNTPCVEVHCGDHLIILDAGTGIRPFGLALDQSRPIEADIFFSVSRFDHACGLPFFGAGYNPANEFKVWAGHLGAGGSIENDLNELMTSPLFPIPLSFIGGQLREPTNLTEDGRFTSYYDRSEIIDGALEGRAPVIGWAKDPIDFFFLQIQIRARSMAPNPRRISSAIGTRSGMNRSSRNTIAVTANK